MTVPPKKGFWIFGIKIFTQDLKKKAWLGPLMEKVLFT